MEGFVFGGDAWDLQCISPHTKGRPRLRSLSAFKREEEAFDREILRPIETLLPESAEKVFILGNHEDWQEQLVDEQPELDGIQREKSLKLASRGWKIIPCGGSYKHGKLTYIHGEWLTGQSHAKKCVETMCANTVYGHFHTVQSWTKILPNDHKQKWIAQCAPVGCKLEHNYLRGAPTSWVNGWIVVEYHPGGNFNMYPVLVVDGLASYGGRIYG